MIQSGLERTSCLFCGADDGAPWRDEGGFQAVKCRRCGLVYVDPRPTPDSLAQAVQLGAHRAGGETLDVVGRFHPERVPKFRRRLRQSFPSDAFRGRPLRWLDVGAGFGELLLALRGLLPAGSVLHGVEPCEPKSRKARALGLDVRTALEDAEAAYDVVSLVNVLSHLRDPGGFLRELRGRLRSGGSLLLVTGNGGDVRPDEYPDALYLPDHLVFAGETHVIELCRRAGLEVAGVVRHRQFLPESTAMMAARHWYNRARGRPSRLALASRWWGPFRSLWVRAILSP